MDDPFDDPKDAGTSQGGECSQVCVVRSDRFSVIDFLMKASKTCLMTTASKVRATRTTLLALIIIGLALGVFGAVVGIGVPGIIISVAGWAAVIAGIVWLLVRRTERPRPTPRTQPWRPADGDTTP